MLCSEILNVHLQSKVGRERVLSVNLRRSGHRVQSSGTDVRIRECTSLTLVTGGREFRGQVAAPTLRSQLGYVVELLFGRVSPASLAQAASASRLQG